MEYGLRFGYNAGVMGDVARSEYGTARPALLIPQVRNLVTPPGSAGDIS